MPTNETQISNLALSHLGVGKQISNFTTEQSQEAKACREFYPICRDIVLRDFEWPFATQFQNLALVEETPTDEWDYSYRYPSSCSKIRRILNPNKRWDTRQSRIPYRVVRDPDGAGKLIYTDQESACVEFTYKETNPERYDDDFVMALSLLLASYIAPRLTRGDPFKLGERSFQLYRLNIGKSEASAVNEEQPEEEVDSEFIRERNA